MFELTSKMTHQEFQALGKSAEDLGFEVASSLCACSDAEESSFGNGHLYEIEMDGVNFQWRSGEDVRDIALEHGKWGDGEPIGRGHGSPYLQPKWAADIHAVVKRIEGRPRWMFVCH